GGGGAGGAAVGAGGDDPSDADGAGDGEAPFEVGRFEERGDRRGVGGVCGGAAAGALARLREVGEASERFHPAVWKGGLDLPAGLGGGEEKERLFALRAAPENDGRSEKRGNRLSRLSGFAVRRPARCLRAGDDGGAARAALRLVEERAGAAPGEDRRLAGQAEERISLALLPLRKTAGVRTAGPRSDGVQL